MSGLLAIVNASDDDFNKLTEAINHSDGAAKQAAETMQDNLKGAMEELGEVLKPWVWRFMSRFKYPQKCGTAGHRNISTK